MKSDYVTLRTLVGANALCPPSNWGLCPRWWNWVPLANYMLGSSGHNMENLTIVVERVWKDVTFLAR